jgi:hypothetical protein
MTWQIDDQELKAVLALPGERRYSYFLKRVVEWQQVWSLWGKNGWVLTGDDAGHEVVPIWPHPRFAEACISDEWSGTQPRAIALAEWLEYWLPGLAKDQRLVGVFPGVSMERVTVVVPDRLKRDLEEILSFC